jgi:hypothetical protein
LLSKIQAVAPVLLPDALKIMGDFGQLSTDFLKLEADLQKVTGQPPASV